MRALVWITESGWEQCVDHAASLLPHDAEVTLLYVIDSGATELAEHPGPGRLGRHRPPPEVAPVGEIAESEARELLAEAAERLGRDAEVEVRRGRVEHTVAHAAEDADLLVVTRDGHPQRGPKSLGPRSRFVVDHASCTVLLVWAVEREQREKRALPPPPPPGHRRHS